MSLGDSKYLQMIYGFRKDGRRKQYEDFSSMSEAVRELVEDVKKSKVSLPDGFSTKQLLEVRQLFFKSVSRVAEKACAIL